MLNHLLAIIVICIVFFTFRYIWHRWQRGDLNYHKVTKFLTRKRLFPSFSVDNDDDDNDVFKSDSSSTSYSFYGDGKEDHVNNDNGGGGDITRDNSNIRKQKAKRTRKWSFNLRKWTFDYIAALEDGKRSKFEVRLWRGLNSYISDKWKDTNQETGITYPLPLWIEEFVRLLHHENTHHVVCLILIYIICVVIVFPLLTWLFIEISPFVFIVISSIESSVKHGSGGDMKISKEEADNIAKLIAMYPEDFIYDYESAFLYFNCQSFYSFIARHITMNAVADSDGDDNLLKWFAYHNITMNHSYCKSTKGKEMWLDDNESWPLLFTKHHYNTVDTHDAATPDARSHSITEIFLDSRYRVHFFLDIIESSSSPSSLQSSIERSFTNEKKKSHNSVKSKRKTVLVNENTIINLLIHIENETRQTCICPLLIGIKGNLTFLYRESKPQKWIILHEPYLYRNNTLSDELETSITFDRQDLPVFFHNNQQLMNRKDDNDETAASSSTKTLRHYNIFNLEYTQINRIGDDNDDNGVRIHQDEVNTIKMRSLLLDEDKTLLFMPFKSVGHYQTRERLILSENEAICFIHCNEMNK